MEGPLNCHEQVFVRSARRSAVATRNRASMTDVDFVEGILTIAALEGHRQFSVADTRLDQAMAAAYELLVKSDEAEGLEIEFQVRPHPIHGDSPVVQGALNAAIGDRRAMRLNPTFRLVETTTLLVEPEASDQFLRRLPGGRKLYERLAERFLEAYAAPSPGARAKTATA